MSTTIEYIKNLREQTGAGILECRRALEESNYQYEPALAILREMAARKAARNADREANQGVVEVYTHNGGRIGVMVEVNCETDFTARSEKFRAFAHELALHIVSECPLWVTDADIPAEVIEEERNKVTARARAEGKPDALLQRIGDGAVEKYMNKTVLLRQPSLRDDLVTVGQMVTQIAGVTVENICVRRFVRWELAETAGGEPSDG
jgi:elongation factor Ts